jgi:DNA-binding NtrC family response regulator
MHDMRFFEEPCSEEATETPRAATSRSLDASALWAELREYRRRREAWEAELHRLVQSRRDLEARHFQLVLHAAEALASLEERGAAVSLAPPVGQGPRFDERVSLFERALLEAGLARAGGCRSRAAAALGLLPTTLGEKLKRLGIRRGPKGS